MLCGRLLGQLKKPQRFLHQRFPFKSGFQIIVSIILFPAYDSSDSGDPIEACTDDLGDRKDQNHWITTRLYPSDLIFAIARIVHSDLND